MQCQLEREEGIVSNQEVVSEQPISGEIRWERHLAPCDPAGISTLHTAVLVHGLLAWHWLRGALRGRAAPLSANTEIIVGVGRVIGALHGLATIALSALLRPENLAEPAPGAETPTASPTPPAIRAHVVAHSPTSHSTARKCHGSGRAAALRLVPGISVGLDHRSSAIVGLVAPWGVPNLIPIRRIIRVRIHATPLRGSKIGSPVLLGSTAAAACVDNGGAAAARFHDAGPTTYSRGSGAS
mmetsp:Transcript_9397/g.20590  ORF Transcript_9397/g.20590 Transcript_9397/m.20590 type:complete len:241 (+) Transcript_9397:369-1091(+)